MGRPSDAAAKWIAVGLRAIAEQEGPTTPELIARKYREAPRDVQRKLLHQLIQRSKTEPTIWDAVKVVAAQSVRSDERLPVELRGRVADVLEEKPDAARPRKRGRDPLDHLTRDLHIVVHVQKLVALGLNPTRNTATDGSGRRSACDVVGDAYGLAPKTVETIWNNRRRVLRKPGS